MMHFVFRAMVALALMSAVSEAQGQSVALAPVQKPGNRTSRGSVCV